MPLSSVLGASSAIRPGVCTSSTRPSTPYTGQLIFETDTSRLAVYNGSAWVTQNGLQYITSASVSAASAITVDNCFSSTYYTYEVHFYGNSSADTTIYLQLRSGGSTNTTSNYHRQYMAVGSTTFTGVRGSSESNFLFGNLWTVSQDNSFIGKIVAPSLPQTTTFHFSTEYGNGITLNYAVGKHVVSTAFDGFIITPTAGTITGTIYVYGYARN